MTEGAGARGVVVDAADGAPVQGALIELVPAGPLILQSVLQGVAFSDTSNEAGEFTVGGLNIGRYLVRVKRAGRAVDHRIV
ncbi:MAG: carboxypeptidase-like regulatory domain-containing protein, partial [Thermoanaerobaculia bacterium]